jgi:hypothetical protein
MLRLLRIERSKKSLKELAEWFSSKFTLYGQSFDYSTPYIIFIKYMSMLRIDNDNECAEIGSRVNLRNSYFK